MTVQVYNGYGHKHDLIVFGHVLKSPVKATKKLTNNFQPTTIAYGNGLAIAARCYGIRRVDFKPVKRGCYRIVLV